MRKLAVGLVLCALAGWTQEWEFGGAGGFGFMKGAGVSGPAGTATAGFQTGGAASAVFAHVANPRWSGEVRYSFLQSNLKLSSGSSQTTFAGRAHALHYDLLIFPGAPRARTRPFVAAGGGMKLYQGTGAEHAFQPLSQFAYLTRTRELKPMISAGGGVKTEIRPGLVLRVEFRDYVTPFPKELIAPAPGNKIAGWVHDFVPRVGISRVW